MGKILFVGHEATRTGAPYVLLHLLRWLRANPSAECRLLLLDGGELVSEFAEVSHVSILGPEEVDNNNIVSRGLRYLGYYRRNFIKRVARLKETLIREGVDLIYSNTS